MTTYLWGTGLETGTLEVFSELSSYSLLAISQDTFHTGSFGLRMTKPSWVRIAAPKEQLELGQRNDLYISYWQKPFGAGTGGTHFFGVRAKGGDNEVSLWLDAPYWNAYVGDGTGDPVAYGSRYIVWDAWHNVQLRVKIANSGGIIQTRIDGHDDIDYQGDTQLSVDSDQLDYFEFYFYSTGSVIQTYLDDIVVAKGGWPAPMRFDGLIPNGDDAVQWARSSGNDNYELVNDVDSTIDDNYVKTSTNGQEDLYDVANWDDDENDDGNSDKTPLMLAHWVRAVEDQDAAAIQLLLKHNTNRLESKSWQLGTTLWNYYQVAQSAPGGGALTKSVIDSLAMGIKSVIS
jgi:hypothetical protein